MARLPETGPGDFVQLLFTPEKGACRPLFLGVHLELTDCTGSYRQISKSRAIVGVLSLAIFGKKPWGCHGEELQTHDNKHICPRDISILKVSSEPSILLDNSGI